MVCHNQGNLISKKKYMVEPFANSFPAFADDRFQWESCWATFQQCYILYKNAFNVPSLTKNDFILLFAENLSLYWMA